VWDAGTCGKGDRMRRVPRHLLTACTALSLLLCIVVCVLWVRSYWGVDYVSIYHSSPPGQEPGNVAMGGWTNRGGLVLQRTQRVSLTAEDAVQWSADRGRRSFHDRPDLLKLPTFYRDPVLGFRYANGSIGTKAEPGSLRGVVVPMWSICLALATPPALSYASRHRRRSRLRAGLCQACGYDLRATPDRCPACGATAGPMALA
jgi:hypothetical protein